MTKEQYNKLLDYKNFLDMSLSCSFVRMTQAQFKAIEDIYGHEDFNHSCRVCNLNYLRKVAREFNEFAVLLKPEPEPVTDSVSETKNNKPIKKATNKDTNGRKNKANNTKKA